MKKFGYNTQKGKIIRSMILMGTDRYYQDFEIENFSLIWNSNNVGARLSELLKANIVEVIYFENPKMFRGGHCFHKAKYRLKKEFVSFYKEFYGVSKMTFWERLFC